MLQSSDCIFKKFADDTACSDLPRDLIPPGCREKRRKTMYVRLVCWPLHACRWKVLSKLAACVGPNKEVFFLFLPVYLPQSGCAPKMRLRLVNKQCIHEWLTAREAKEK